MFDQLSAIKPSPSPSTLAPRPLPTPIVNVTVSTPPEEVNWLSVFSEGLIGAVVGAVVGGLVAIWVVRATIGADRRARAEEQRAALASKIVSDIDALDWELSITADHVSLFRSAIPLLSGSSRLRVIYGGDPDHQRFVKWLDDEVDSFGRKLHKLILGWEQRESEELTTLRRTAQIDLKVMGRSIDKWISCDPREWQPVDEARKRWEEDPESFVPEDLRVPQA